jgi:hypothetical protein
MTRRLKIWASCVAILLAVGAGAWYLRGHQRIEGETPISRGQIAPYVPATAKGAEQTPSIERSKTPTAPRDIQKDFKRANDYAEFARSIRAEAEAGKPEAQYFLEEALRYCQQNLSRYFLVPGRRARTLDEAQIRWATKGPGISQEMMQQEIIDIYSRCHVFLEDPSARAQLEEWTSWLDKASGNGYPLAEGIKAILLAGETRIAELSRDPTIRADPEAMKRAHELALNALQSGDPAVLWQMADLVDETGTPQDKLGVMPGAWRLLACDRGYDCSPQAEWLRSRCNFDPQCTPGESGQQLLARNLGDNFDEAKRLASEIAAVVDSKNRDKLPTYLWGNE